MLGIRVLDFFGAPVFRVLFGSLIRPPMFPSSMQPGLETFRCIVEVGLAGVGFAFLPSLGWG